jgi:hypothetical protein
MNTDFDGKWIGWLGICLIVAACADARQPMRSQASNDVHWGSDGDGEAGDGNDRSSDASNETSRGIDSEVVVSSEPCEGGRWGPGCRLAPCLPGRPEASSCYEGICLPSRFGTVCSWDTGLGSCASGFLAVQIHAGSNDSFWGCIPASVVDGQPCSSHDECRPWTAFGLVGYSWVCAWSEGNPAFRQCTSPCDTSEDSCFNPATTCSTAAQDKRLDDEGFCLSTGALACPRSAELSEAKGTCRRSNVHGTCSGIAACDGYGPDVFPVCDAPEPASETCGPAGTGDGIDQDCDGETDEGCEP